ncbi:hypothetical protein OKA05_26935 [Luteolibacter arcticus]|uniref:Uncharacterized protein n=1 Tax=Luteolibacter arcticus TaxID=1581411 RepID=A0ABT3GRT9_9BACT|nr:hypothetical protein [Luteolibacter arcticus]MCW1926222.1 hypothetical protein [Luteolibacter arcticus]
MPRPSNPFILGPVDDKPDTRQKRPPTWRYRDRDERLYVALMGYCLVSFLLVKLSYGSVSSYLFTAIVVPLLALIALIVFQVSARPRPSPLAFALVFAGILGVAYGVLLIAAEASAAV